MRCEGSPFSMVCWSHYIVTRTTHGSMHSPTVNAHHEQPVLGFATHHLITLAAGISLLPDVSLLYLLSPATTM